MNANAQKTLDMRAMEMAEEAKSIAETTRERIHAEFRGFERQNSAWHNSVLAKVDGLREHISVKVGKVHKRIDQLVILTFCAVIGLLISVVAWLLDHSPPWRSVG